MCGREFFCVSIRKKNKLDYLEVFGIDVAMDIGTNELTRPFRIPRKKGGKNDDEKVFVFFLPR